MTELYPLTGRAKQSRAVAHVLRWCGRNPGGAKLLVFAHHSEMLDALQANANPILNPNPDPNPDPNPNPNPDPYPNPNPSPDPNPNPEPKPGPNPNLYPNQAALKTRGVGAMRIDGGTAAKKRQDLVSSFQDATAAASPRVALLSINAAGQGLTLTAAHDAVSNPNPSPNPNPTSNPNPNNPDPSPYLNPNPDPNPYLNPSLSP